MANTVYVNVSGTWKQASAYYVNVSGTWKTGTEFQTRVSGTWKGGAGVAQGLPSISALKGLDVLGFVLPTIGTIDAKSSIDSYKLDTLGFVVPVFGMDS